MLHVRVIAPHDLATQAVRLVDGDPTVANLAVVTGAARSPDGDLVMFDLARENATTVIDGLRRLGIEDAGSIAVQEAETVFSRAAERAERTAPGRPVDAVIWDAIELQAKRDGQLSWSFLVFLVLATLIAGAGRYLDQPILIVGAMVVGPEFAPVSAMCFGLARRRLGIVGPAVVTLVFGFVLAIVVATVWWWVAHTAGWISTRRAGTGALTNFIVEPDVWSLVIALLAGVAGVLSLTASKSATLVGVFISVTTVPAAGAAGLTLATGLWHEAGRSLLQLLVNLCGMLLAGTVTLLVQRFVWDRVASR